jgi:hypothetical protein
MKVIILLPLSLVTRGLRCRPEAARLLVSRVRISLGAWMYVYCEYCVLFRYRSLRRADHTSRGVKGRVVCLSVIVKLRQGGGPGTSRTVAPRGKSVLLPSCNSIYFNLALCLRIIYLFQVYLFRSHLISCY